MPVNLPSAALAFITALESVSGVPIAILDRIDDTQMFWVRSAAILCQKTGENFCDEDMRFMTSNTEPLGQSHIIEYKSQKDGKLRRVCAIIPPITNIDPALVAEAYGNPHPGLLQVPSSLEAYSWLMLYHASHCLDTELVPAEENRAAALATLGLAVLEGEPRFTAGIHRSPARMMAVMTGLAPAYWAAGTGERILLDLWKDEAADILRSQFGCYVVVSQSTSIDIEKVTRDRTLELSPTSCATPGTGGGYAQQQVRVTDSNLWLWMYGDPMGFAGLGAPPKPYEMAKPFPDMKTAASYVLQTANSLAD